MSPFFTTEFEKLFTQSSHQTSSAQIQGGADEDWANVSLPSRTRGQATENIASTAIPALDELPRPEMLLAAQTPYHMIVKVVHNGMIVQCSHQGSLELLAGYLKKYTRDTPDQSVKVSCALRVWLRISVYAQNIPWDSCLSSTDSTPQRRAPSLAFWLRCHVRFTYHHARRPSQRLGEHQSHPGSFFRRRCTWLLTRCGWKRRVSMVFQARCSVQGVVIEIRSSKV